MLPTPTSRVDIAVVEIDGTGAGTLHLDGQRIDHIVDAQPCLVVRLLLDYAMTVGRDLTVLTRYADGQSAFYQLHPDGTVKHLRRQSTPSALASPVAREHRRLSGREVRTPNPRDRALVATTRKWSRRWLAGYGLWLMLCTQILLLVGSLTYIVVALAPYLSP